MANKQQQKENALSVFKGVGLALIVTLVGILIFALILKMTGLTGLVVKAVNQFIKILSIFLGCMFFVGNNKGLAKGILIGLIYTLICYCIFFLLGTTLTPTNMLVDMICGGVIGAISGIVSVNLKK